jgi:4-amino-4-deoxy-L-arabinose transferase-like glycosyltransferase
LTVTVSNLRGEFNGSTESASRCIVARMVKHNLQFSHLLVVAVLLLVGFFIRSQNILALDPYIDEGFHLRRAAIVWDLEVNPGRIAHGKPLIYYWYGLFEADPRNTLFTSRLGMAIFSVFSGAVLYAFGRTIHSHRVGVLALGLYAITPYAFFFERMAMADPITSVFALLLAWRSLTFARRPSLRAGLVIGSLVAMTTLTKLTMGLAPLIPVAATVIFFPWKWPLQINAWLRRYFLPLTVAAVVVILMWLPILIPAYMARNSDDPFTLTDPVSFREEKVRFAPLNYLNEVELEIDEMLTYELPVLVGLALVYWFGAQHGSPQVRTMLFLLAWTVIMAAPTLTLARLYTSRYLMPLVAPMVLILAYMVFSLWPRHRLVSGGLIGAVVIWALTFALPFASTALNQPENLNFAYSSTNHVEYLSGNLTGEVAVRQAADHLNDVDPTHIYANWALCHLIYFYSENDVTCLHRNHAVEDLNRYLRQDVEPGEGVYITFAGFPQFWADYDWLEWEEVAVYERQLIDRPVTIWRVTVLVDSG